MRRGLQKSGLFVEHIVEKGLAISAAVSTVRPIDAYEVRPRLPEIRSLYSVARSYLGRLSRSRVFKLKWIKSVGKTECLPTPLRQFFIGKQGG
jgi:hypothetical protein